MKILLLGKNGQVGWELQRALAPLGAMVALDRAGADGLRGDLEDLDGLARTVRKLAPDVIVNAAAYTAVDKAETDVARAQCINAEAPGVLAAAAAEVGALLVHYSTDYVFDGTAASPYAEDATPAPRSAYGRTKLAGERAALSHPHSYVLRTAWLYGAHGQNFVKTMLHLERTRETVSVVDDQVGQPTWSMDLARQIDMLVRSDAPVGIYHATNAGRASWYEFARRIFADAGADPERVLPTATEQFPRRAPRPANSVLSHSRWAQVGLAPMRAWDDALAEALPVIIAAER